MGNVIVIVIVAGIVLVSARALMKDRGASCASCGRCGKRDPQKPCGG